MSAFDTAALRRFVETFADRIHERRDELTQLDSAIGDADHGINMDRGFTAVRGKLAELPPDADLGTVAKKVGMTLISTVGVASGPLYGTFFLRLSSCFGYSWDVEAKVLGEVFMSFDV
jgi:dihydroxyacetone kinase-like protein